MEIRHTLIKYKPDVILKNAFLIMETPFFFEYARRDSKGLFVRIDKSLKDGDFAQAYLEPQINFSRSIKDNKLCYKMQISILAKSVCFGYGYRTVNFNRITKLDKEFYQTKIRRLTVEGVMKEIFFGCQKDLLTPLIVESETL